MLSEQMVGAVSRFNPQGCQRIETTYICYIIA